MHRIRWIHLSDLHLGNDEAVDTILMREKLPNYIANHFQKFDYMFCTGDVKEWNTDFSQAPQYLTLLCEVAGVPLENLYIVPGNHDVEIGGDDRAAVIEKITDWESDEYDSKIGVISKTDMTLLRSGQSTFNAFISEFLGAERAEKYTSPHFIITTEHLNILHLDSTITYGKGHNRDFVIGTHALIDALAKRDKTKPTIILTHYSFDFLTQNERNEVENILDSCHVQLWLAGHEHENLIRRQRDKFIECQCGNLALQKGARSCFLTGELDLDTGEGKITVHAWYEGKNWEVYPFARNGSENDRIYLFHLQFPGDNGISREAAKVRRANQEFLDQFSVIDELIPEIDELIQGNTDDGGENREEDRTLAKILSYAWNTDNPHRILIADGGMGKTTMLLKLCRDSRIPVLYISAERLTALRISIKDYCARVLFDGDLGTFERFVSKNYTNPTLVLLIDGLNEVEPRVEQEFIKELKALNLLNGIQFVVSSRSDFTSRYRMSGYKLIHLKPLSDAKKEAVFSSEEWVEIKDSATLCHLLSNPMMVTMYKEISPVVKQYELEECLNWVITIKNATDLLHNYYVAQLAIMLYRNGVDGRKAQLAYLSLFDVLPAVAYAYESTHSLNKINADFRSILAEIISKHSTDEMALAPIQEHFREYEIPTLNTGEILDFLTEETHLLHKDNVFTSFSHQIYRDYLSAFWIVKQTDIERYWNTRGIPLPVMGHIRNLSGKYWEGLAKRVHEAGKNREDAFHLTGNLLDCFKYTNTSGCPDYSYLDLRGLQIPDVTEISKQKISLKGAKIDSVSIGKSNARLLQYTHLCFSEENEYLAGVADGDVYVFSLQTEDKPFIYTVGDGISRISCVENYIFVTKDGVNAGIIVFKRNDAWTYVGVIKNSDEMHCSLFNSSLRSIVLRDCILYFYYNNREVRFELSECRRVYNQKKKRAWKETIDGIDVTFLKNRETQRRNANIGVIWCTENSGLTATATLDGDLTVASGHEVQHILARGITLLKDGSISGDGKCAATLSYELFNGQRKIQLWDLDRKLRVGDLLCPGILGKIHLSEDGSFVLGQTDRDTWVYDRLNGAEQWYHEHFVSNQHGKISTYGTKVFRKDSSKDLYLYDLRTGKTEKFETTCKNARLACVMSDGSIATVGNNAYKVKFKNIRTGKYPEVNSQSTPVIGINSFKNKPFIAVATQDNVISIYHIGDCGRKRILNAEAGNYMMVVSPENTVIACSNGKKKFQTFNYYEKFVSGKKMGWWYPNLYSSQDPKIQGNVLDLAFNTENHELVVILTNGQIVFCHEKYCRFHGATDIITNFNVDSYDFRSCICEEEISKQIRQNGGLI